jgi:hypothetical protein
VQARVTSTGGTHGRLRLNDKETEFSLSPGNSIVIGPDLKPASAD